MDTPARVIAQRDDTNAMEKLLELAGRYPLDFVSHLSSLFPIVTGIITLWFQRPAHRIIWLFFIFLFIKDSYALWYSYHAQNNLFIQNLETVFETGLVGFIYYQAFSDKLPKRIIAGAGVLTITAIVLSYTNERISLISLVAFRFYSIGVSLAYFNKIIADLRIRNILKHTLFWFSAGLLVFVTGTFFTSLFSDYLLNPQAADDDTYDRYSNIGQLIFTVFSLLSAVGLWMSKYDRDNLM